MMAAAPRRGESKGIPHQRHKKPIKAKILSQFSLAMACCLAEMPPAKKVSKAVALALLLYRDPAELLLPITAGIVRFSPWGICLYVCRGGGITCPP